tara:strand:- start:1113 stop:1946 length:834 start_codon:yes stop_codon:yes gene_type:complete
MYLINRGEGGRLGNQFMRNFIIYYLVKKYNFKISAKYSDEDKFIALGLPFVNQDNNIKCDKEEILSINALESIKKLTKLSDIKLNWGTKYYLSGRSYFQSRKYAKFILHQFNKKNNIMIKGYCKKNKYKKRFQRNNDLFIHVRSGNFFRKNPPTIPKIDYYDYILEKLKDQYENIYVCSDDPNDSIVRSLVTNYGAKVPEINNNMIDTILFGSTCKHVVLSSGSFSFMIGLFSYFSENVFYSINAGKFGKKLNKKWHPDYYMSMDTVDSNKYKRIDL